MQRRAAPGSCGSVLRAVWIQGMSRGVTRASLWLCGRRRGCTGVLGVRRGGAEGSSLQQVRDWPPKEEKLGNLYHCLAALLP